MKLEPGDKVWVTQHDGSTVRGWAEWDGEQWNAPCGVPYLLHELRGYLRPETIFHHKPNWLFMAEQLIAEGAM